jgi:rRNA processing
MKVQTKSIKSLHGKKLEVRKYVNWKNTQQARQKIIQGKIHKKHASLRKYAKLCEREGIVSDRVNISNNKVNTDMKQDSNDVTRPTKTEPLPKISKANPFAHAMEVAKKKEAEKHEHLKMKETKALEIQAAAKKRQAKQKEFMQRTKRGQPVLHNQIKNILTKLQAGK